MGRRDRAVGLLPPIFENFSLIISPPVVPHLFNPFPCNLKSQFAFFTPHLPSHSVQLCLFSPVFFYLPFNFLRGFLPHLSKEVRASCFAPLLLSNILLKARLRTLARSFVEEFFTSRHLFQSCKLLEN